MKGSRWKHESAEGEKLSCGTDPAKPASWGGSSAASVTCPSGPSLAAGTRVVRLCLTRSLDTAVYPGTMCHAKKASVCSRGDAERAESHGGRWLTAPRCLGARPFIRRDLGHAISCLPYLCARVHAHAHTHHLPTPPPPHRHSGGLELLPSTIRCSI